MICKEINNCFESAISNKKGICYTGQNCIVSADKRSKVTCEESRKTYCLKNNGKFVMKCRIDGGAIKEDKTVPNGLQKCDFLYLIKSVEDTAILIELKGVMIKKAIQQILSTFKIYGELLKRYSKVYVRIVVTSSVPKIKSDPDYIKLSKLVKGTYKGNIKIKTKNFEESILDVEKE